MLKEDVCRDRQKISILVELTVCQKNEAKALNSVVIILKNKEQFVTFPFFYVVELQNFLNAPRIYACLSYRFLPLHNSLKLSVFTHMQNFQG